MDEKNTQSQEQNQNQNQNQNPKIKTRQGSGFLKQLYSTARTTAGSTHSHLKNLTTFLVNFVPVDKVDASELQVRTHFDEEEVQSLANSIKEHGVLQPILVVQDGDRYKVIAGERRLRASKLAGVDRIPARVLSTDDKATHEIALRENLDRVDLHPIEEGEGYLSLLEAQAYTSHDSIAKAFGKPKSRITECIGYTRLPQETKFELMKRNLKNRALLRQLLNTPVEEHLKIIEDIVGQDGIISPSSTSPEASGETLSSEQIERAKAAAKPKREEKPFIFEMNSKGLKVPSFRWKAGEGTEKLESYLNSLKKLISEIEDRLTSPNQEESENK